MASNPPCFAFINFRHRSDGERAIKELDGTYEDTFFLYSNNYLIYLYRILAGQRIGMSWARPRHYGGRSRRRKLN